MIEYWRFWRFWLGRHLIHLGLKVWPNGRAKRELTDVITLWGDDVVTEVLLSRRREK